MVSGKVMDGLRLASARVCVSLDQSVLACSAIAGMVRGLSSALTRWRDNILIAHINRWENGWGIHVQQDATGRAWSGAALSGKYPPAENG